MISGRVLKLVEFSKDLFIDVYDQHGNLVEGVLSRMMLVDDFVKFIQNYCFVYLSFNYNFM